MTRNRAFLDSNVLLYLIEDSDRATRAAALVSEGGIVSVQVLNEFVSVCQRKKRLPLPSIRMALAKITPLLDVRGIILPTHEAALNIAERYGFSFYDSLIVAAALQAQCDTLYTEDLQDGQVIEGSLRIVNPFA